MEEINYHLDELTSSIQKMRIEKGQKPLSTKQIAQAIHEDDDFRRKLLKRLGKRVNDEDRKTKINDDLLEFLNSRLDGILLNESLIEEESDEEMYCSDDESDEEPDKMYLFQKAIEEFGLEMPNIDYDYQDFVEEADVEVFSDQTSMERLVEEIINDDENVPYDHMEEEELEAELENDFIVEEEEYLLDYMDMILSKFDEANNECHEHPMNDTFREQVKSMMNRERPFALDYNHDHDLEGGINDGELTFEEAEQDIDEFMTLLEEYESPLMKAFKEQARRLDALLEVYPGNTEEQLHKDLHNYHDYMFEPEKKPKELKRIIKLMKNTCDDLEEKMTKGQYKQWEEEVAISEIKEEQEKTDLIVNPKAHEMLVREIAQDFKTDLEFEPEALEMIQAISEAYLIEHFEKSNMMAVHGGIGPSMQVGLTHTGITRALEEG